MAAKVSALLEAVELDAAERLPPPDSLVPLSAMADDALVAWSTAVRHDHGLHLHPGHNRRWMQGVCLLSGRAFPVPWDLVSLDYTVPTAPDVAASSSGLATGNTLIEAAVSAVGEVLERDLTVAFGEASRRMRRALEIDPDSISDPLIRPLLVKIARAGFDLRLWSLGQPFGIAALRCAIVARGTHVSLPPTVGSGCHPSRQTATLRAVLEAVQVHATLVAGARDDLDQSTYDDPNGEKRDLLFDTISLSGATEPWSKIPDVPAGTLAQSLEILLQVAARRSSLPIIGLTHDSGIAGLTVFRIVAPGLADDTRATSPEPPSARVFPSVRANRGRPPIVFVGPTLAPEDVPRSIEARPPAIAGDMIQLLADPPPAIGLIDGSFETAPSVWHKEILHLMAAGIPVFGAASLGALRAAELDRLGMTGIGRIYASYRDGTIRRDDAVMLTHAPVELGNRPLTLTLVDAEAAIMVVPMAACDRRMLLRIARTMSYTERTWDNCLIAFRERTGQSISAGIDAFVDQPSLKRLDALELLTSLLTAGPSDRRPMPPLTSPYCRLLARVMPDPR